MPRPTKEVALLVSDDSVDRAPMKDALGNEVTSKVKSMPIYTDPDDINVEVQLH
eukprot:CAMPEP_0116041480 /NCGR_PEP_ID=MMETSP0321-20121206/25085_1 /TAXON_ID=163516 /ORGANISM="Leptocylindrus danicus var. danicus, Strain B650" /LENGTH=53 /DNA_ID=CAMNT_0003521705 /DNA_START=68 /DNA_END=226 /DNA_ORIENTATION=+